MKQNEVIRVLGEELGAKDLESLNKVFKSKDYNTRFRMTGPGFVHSGFTGLIKALTKDGIKIYNVSRVNLIRYEDIDSIAKAVPKEEKEKLKTKPSAKPAMPPKSKIQSHSKSAQVWDDLEDDEDYENDDDFDPYADEDDDIIEGDEYRQKIVTDEPERPSKKKRLHVAGSGSLFISKKKN